MNAEHSDPAVAEYLAEWRHDSHQVDDWPHAKMETQAAITTRLPPDHFVHSIRAILTRGNTVLVLRNTVDGEHLLPGGRREPGESWLDTLTREMFEETGYALASTRLLGVISFRHLSERPPQCPPHLYPRFFNVVYHAEAGDHQPERLVPDDFESVVGFRAIDEALNMPLDPLNKLFLQQLGHGA